MSKDNFCSVAKLKLCAYISKNQECVSHLKCEYKVKRYWCPLDYKYKTEGDKCPLGDKIKEWYCNGCGLKKSVNKCGVIDG